MISKIIIEGPDCSGKSTVVERIKNMLHWDSKSLHHKPGNQFSRYLKEYVLNENIVFDRSHFSELVYSILWRDGNPFFGRELEILNNLVQRDTLIIFTCPDINVIKQRYKNRSFNQQIKFSELEKSRELFCNVFDKIPYIIYKSENYEELDELLAKVKEMIK